MSNKEKALAILGGLAAGIIIGYLTAPASGRETRKKLVKGATGLTDTLGYRILQAEDMLGKLRKKASEAAGDAGDALASNGKESAAKARRAQSA